VPAGDHLPTYDRATEAVRTAGRGEIVVSISHLSVDSTMRGWMNNSPCYIPPIEIGTVMRALALGPVTASDNFPPGPPWPALGTLAAE
jgi:NADPH-dependent curcumin reductase CurA